MITARSAGDPVTASVTLSMIGCVRLKFAPGISARSLRGDLVHQVRLAHALGPCVVRLQRDEELVAVGAVRVGAGIVAARLRTHQLHLRKLLQDTGGCCCDFVRRFGQRDPRGKVCAHPDRALVELRQELAAQRPPSTKAAPTTSRARKPP